MKPNILVDEAIAENKEKIKYLRIFCSITLK